MADRVILIADDGMVLTNGTDYGTIIYLAAGVDPAAYYQISAEEYNVIMESEPAEEADYKAALAKLGVE